MKTLVTTLAFTILSLSTIQSFAHKAPDSEPVTPKKTVYIDTCKVCQGNEFIFDGAGVSFMRVFNYKGHLIELKTMFPKSQIIYNFEKIGNYRIELNYLNGTVLKKDVIVLN